jgi:uncharacterized protein CbrC (UPF0167 family)
MPDSVVPALALPKFKYHPDPIATGSIAQLSGECAACHLTRGWTYVGPVYGQFEDQPVICPCCIADGSAHGLLGVEFVDPPGVGGYGDWDSVPQGVVDEVCFRTPSFNGWQQERWYTHCGDAAEFSGVVGVTELLGFDPAAYAAIAKESGLTGTELEDYMARLDGDSGPSAYLFRCGTCGSFGGYSDTH